MRARAGKQRPFAGPHVRPIGVVAACAVACIAFGCGHAPSQPALAEANTLAKQPAPAPSPVAEPAAPAVSNAAPVTLSVIGTNDIHGRLQQLPLLGGYVRNLRSARAQDGGDVLLLDGGDMFQGTLASNLTEGAAMVRGYNALHYTAATVGNHEFDFGPAGPHPLAVSAGEDPLGALRERAAQVQFPLLSSNIKAKDGSAFPIASIVPSVMIERLGVRIGIVGGITKDALTATQAANVSGLMLEPLAVSIARESQALRARGAQLVIAVVHAGGGCGDVEHPEDVSTCEPSSEGFLLARALAPGAVDLIVGGHTHAGIAHLVNDIPIIESYSSARAFGRVDFSLDRTSGRVLSRHIFPPHLLCTEALDQPQCADESYEGQPVQRDEAVHAAIAADLVNASQEQARPIGVVLDTDIKRKHDEESPLGNLVADIIHRTFPKADVAINNAGSVRLGLTAGPLTYGQLFEMFPFDNAFATVRMPARTLATIVAKNLQSDHGFLALSGVRASAHCDGSTLAVQLRRDDGKPLRPETMLDVVMSDFLAAGGDDLLDQPPGAVEIHRDTMVRDALVRGFAKYSGGHIDGKARALFDPAHPRVRYTGARPLHCETQESPLAQP